MSRNGAAAEPASQPEPEATNTNKGFSLKKQKPVCPAGHRLRVQHRQLSSAELPCAAPVPAHRRSPGGRQAAAAAGLALRRAGERVRRPPGGQQADERVLHVGVPLEGVADVFDNSLDQHVHLLLTLRHLFWDSDVTWRELFPVEK